MTYTRHFKTICHAVTGKVCFKARKYRKVLEIPIYKPPFRVHKASIKAYAGQTPPIHPVGRLDLGTRQTLESP